MTVKLKKIAICLFALLFVSLISLTSCIDIDRIAIDLGLFPREDIDYGKEHTVILADTAGLQVMGDSSKKVAGGGRAEFRFKISDDYIYVGNSEDITPARGLDGSYILTLKNVKGPSTIEVKLFPKSELLFVNLYNKLSGAKLEYIQGASMLMGASDVKIKATAPEGFYFSGWSKGAYESDGGQVISREQEYAFTPTDRSTAIYANFTEAGHYTINYHVNGGYIVGSEKKIYTVTDSFERLFPMPMTVRENDPRVSFRRDGYTLVGYSTEPIINYSGSISAKNIRGFSNLGGICEIPKSGVLDLYLVWASNTKEERFKVKDATYSDIFTQGSREKTSLSGCVISNYTGSDSTVVIPEIIDGKRVIGIDSGAFGAFGSSSIKKVVIPKTVVRIEDGAFTSSCTSLEELVFFDSLQYVSNGSFPAGLKTVVLDGQRGSVYSGSVEGSFAMKYQRVRSLSAKGVKKLIVLSGSSTMYGLNSRLLGEALEGKYEIVNYGTNANTQATFYLEAMSKYLTSGDIVICAPEWDIGDVNGSNVMHWKLFRGNDQCYDIFREVDMSNYTNFFGAWQEHQTASKSKDLSFAAMAMSIKEYQLDTILNEYGDILGDRYEKIYTDSGKRDLDRYLINNERASNFNRAAKYVTSYGATMLFSFATKDDLYIDPSWKTKADRFTAHYASKLNCPVISNVGTYILDSNLMFNSQWHCNYAGANKRTYELLFDVKRYLTMKKDSFMSISEREKYDTEEFSDSFD